MGCLQQWKPDNAKNANKGSQTMSFQDHCPRFYKGLGDQDRFLMNGKIARFQREVSSGELQANQLSFITQQIFLEAISNHSMRKRLETDHMQYQ